MELKAQALLVAVAVLAWTQLCAWEPIAAISPSDQASDSLATLEDHCAIHHDDGRSLKQLVDRYLELEKPGLAVAVLRTAPRAVLEGIIRDRTVFAMLVA